jgi:uncharacterized membrane protein YraQ (UPF0718 family)
VLETSPSVARQRGAALFFLLLALVLLYVVKWDPYVHKAIKAATDHTLGPSILTGTAAAPPPVSVGAAFAYAVKYFLAIWQALVAGLLLGAGVEVLVPRDLLLRLLGRPGAKSALVGGLAAVPSMMCTCCSAPLAVGLRRAGASPGAVLAYWVGNPVLNPATVVFLGYVLGWRWAALRVVVGCALVAAAAWLGDRYGEGALPTQARAAYEAAAAPSPPQNLFVAWLARAGRLALGLIPEYIVIVLLLGALRHVLFPAMTPAIGASPLLVLGLAIAGTLFVIPTAGEVPILQTLLPYGLGAAGAGALLLTLPAVSLPSLYMVQKALPRRLVLGLGALVAVFGLVAAALAALLHL